ncbi:hypothetical protein KI387_007016, partial [Taxus chinensis]
MGLSFGSFGAFVGTSFSTEFGKSGGDKSSSPLSEASGKTEDSNEEPFSRTSDQESESPTESHEQASPSTIINSHYPSYKPALTSPHDASRQPSIVMQQTYEPSSSIYNPFLRLGSDGDARFPPFVGPTAMRKYNGNAILLSGLSVSTSQDTATSVGVASAALIAQGSQMAGIAPGTMSFPHQQMQLFPQPDGGKGYLSSR